MGFAAISDQLACDDCMDFKQQFENAMDIRISYHIACCFHVLSSPLPLCFDNIGRATKV